MKSPFLGAIDRTPAKSQEPSGIIAALRKHNRLVSLFGATLVLFTYLYNDKVRDSAKRQADDSDAKMATLLAQEDFYLLRHDVNSSASQIMAIERYNATNLHNAIAPPPRPASIAQLVHDATLNAQQQDFDQRDQEGERLNQDYDNLQKLLIRVSPKYASDLKVIGDDLRSQLGEAAQQFSTDFNSELGANPLSPKMSENMHKILSIVAEGSVERDKFLIHVEDVVENQKRRDAAHYERIANWSIALYVIGWLAAVVGQLMGIKGIGGGDE